MQIAMVFLLFFCTILISSCGQSPPQETTKITDTTAQETISEFVKESRKVTPFNKVTIDGNFDVHIICGQAQNVELTARPNLLKLVLTESNQGTLHISYKPDSKINETAPQLTITLPSLERVNLQGANAVTIEQIRGKKLVINAAGSSELDLSGSIDNLEIKTNGTADVDAFELKANNAKVSCAGAGDIELTCSQSLNAKVEGAGRIAYKGNPKHVNQKIEGAGLIENESQNSDDSSSADSAKGEKDDAKETAPNNKEND